jgi:hypothetical protein
MAALRELSPGRLWVAEEPFQMMGLELGARMTVIRLQNGDLFLHSPIALTSELRGELNTLGTVRHLIAPNKMHYLSVDAFATAFPSAHTFGVPGMAENRKEITFHRILGDRPAPEWAAEIDQAFVLGIPKLGEVAFFHQPSRTLILTDLCFYLTSDLSWPTRMYARLSGTLDELGPTLLVKKLTRNRAALRASVDRILQWDFDRVIVTHGRILETGGREVFRRSFEWLKPSA